MNKYNVVVSRGRSCQSLETRDSDKQSRQSSPTLHSYLPNVNEGGLRPGRSAGLLIPRLSVASGGKGSYRDTLLNEPGVYNVAPLRQLPASENRVGYRCANACRSPREISEVQCISGERRPF